MCSTNRVLCYHIRLPAPLSWVNRAARRVLLRQIIIDATANEAGDYANLGAAAGAGRGLGNTNFHVACRLNAAFALERILILSRHLPVTNAVLVTVNYISLFMAPTKYLLLPLLCSLSILAAQDSTSVKAEPFRMTMDQGTQMTIDDPNLRDRLIAGGGFYVSNPEIEYEVDEKKLYLDPNLQSYKITLVGGLTETVPARIQLIDQVVEVNVDGRELQVTGKSLESLTTEDGRRFVAFRRPLIVGEPAPLLEVLQESDNGTLCAYRRVEWREPPQQKTSYDASNYKKRLDRRDQVYLLLPYSAKKIDKLKKLISLLPEDKREEARSYAKAERLRNREGDYAKLLAHLDQGK